MSSPFIVNCDYPSGFMILQHIYKNIIYADNSKMVIGNVSLSCGVCVCAREYLMIIQLLEFDQKEFFSGLVSMDTTGYVYVPTSCQNGAGMYV